MTTKYQQLMASMTGFLAVEGDFPAAFEIFSDSRPEESSSDEEDE